MSGNWFRNSKWDPSTQARFWKKALLLSDFDKSEVLRIKSIYILDEPTADLDALKGALELAVEARRLKGTIGTGTTSAQHQICNALLRLGMVSDARGSILHLLEYMQINTNEQNSGPMLAIWMMFEHDIEPFPLDALEFTLTRATLLTANPRFWRHIGLGYVAEQRGGLAKATEQVREALTCVHTWHNGKPDWGYGEVSELHRTPDRAMAWIRRLVPEVDAMAHGPA